MVVAAEGLLCVRRAGGPAPRAGGGRLAMSCRCPRARVLGWRARVAGDSACSTTAVCVLARARLPQGDDPKPFTFDLVYDDESTQRQVGAGARLRRTHA